MSTIQITELREYLWASVFEAFDTMVSLPLERVEQDDAIRHNGLLLAAAITFTGDRKGSLTLLCSADCARTITRAMLVLEKDDPVQESEINDALGEVVNLAIGGFKTRLSTSGEEIRISIPTVTKGQDMRPIPSAGTEYFSLFSKTEGYALEFVFACK
ncbi:MAG: chemotaxis protein CheX [Sedimentisphaerales bacterium]|nr:chemotaxis protein CheX [Sedimentisphaerales bacterium]